MMIRARDILRLLEMSRNDRRDARRSLENENILTMGIHMACILLWSEDVNIPHWKGELSGLLNNALSDLVSDSRLIAGTQLTSVRGLFLDVHNLAKAVDGRTASAISRALAKMDYPPQTHLDRTDRDRFSQMGFAFEQYVHPRLGINFRIMFDGEVIADTGTRKRG